MLATAALLGLAVAGAWVVRQPNLQIDRSVDPQQITRGKAAYAELRLTNKARLPSAPVIAEEPCGERVVAVRLPRLGSGSTRVQRYQLPTSRRGVIDVGPLRIARRDPMGLLERVQQRGGIEKLWVHPVVHPLDQLPVGTTRSLDGPDADTAPEGSITFHALREWQIGDDPRHIHWRSTAKTGSLMVREHVDTSLPQLMVLLDDRASQHTSDGFEEAVDATASVVVAALTQGFPVQLLTLSGLRARSNRSTDVTTFLDRLAEVQLGDEVDELTLYAEAGRARRGQSLVLVTGELDPDRLDGVLALRRRYGNTAVLSIGTERPGALALPDVTLVHARTAEDFAASWRRALAS